MTMLKYFWIGLFFLCTNLLLGQTIDPTQLEQFGYEEEDIQRKLLERGIDLNQIRPDQIGEFQQALQEVIFELELEKNLNSTAQNDSIPPDSDSTIVDELAISLPDSTQPEQFLQAFGFKILEGRNSQKSLNILSR